MTDERLIPLIYLLCLLLWIAGGRIRDPRLRDLARRAAWVLLAAGIVVALIELGAWLAG